VQLKDFQKLLIVPAGFAETLSSAVKVLCTAVLFWYKLSEEWGNLLSLLEQLSSFIWKQWWLSHYFQRGVGSVAFPPSWQQVTDLNLSCITSLTQCFSLGGGVSFYLGNLWSTILLQHSSTVGEKMPRHFNCTDNEHLLPIAFIYIYIASWLCSFLTLIAFCWHVYAFIQLFLQFTETASLARSDKTCILVLLGTV